jgi:hypothetical protein
MIVIARSIEQGESNVAISGLTALKPTKTISRRGAGNAEKSRPQESVRHSGRRPGIHFHL